MSLVPFVLCLLGTFAVSAAAIVRWPRHLFAVFFTFNLFWSCVFASNGAQVMAAVEASLALVCLVVMAAQQATRGRGVHRAAPTPTRPLRRIP